MDDINLPSTPTKRKRTTPPTIESISDLRSTSQDDFLYDEDSGEYLSTSSETYRQRVVPPHQSHIPGTSYQQGPTGSRPLSEQVLISDPYSSQESALQRIPGTRPTMEEILVREAQASQYHHLHPTLPPLPALHEPEPPQQRRRRGERTPSPRLRPPIHLPLPIPTQQPHSYSSPHPQSTRMHHGQVPDNWEYELPPIASTSTHYTRQTSYTSTNPPEAAETSESGSVRSSTARASTSMNTTGREKIAMACLPCKKAKTKCDGALPCARCVQKRLSKASSKDAGDVEECRYPQSQTRRGPAKRRRGSASAKGGGKGKGGSSKGGGGRGGSRSGKGTDDDDGDLEGD